MKLFLFFALLLITNCSVLFAQSGYFGRKVIIEIGALGRNPAVVHGFGDNPIYFKEKNGTLQNSKNRLDYGFQGGIAYVSNKTVSFGLFGGLYSSQSQSTTGYLNKYYASYSSSVYIDGESVPILQLESFRYRTINIQPTMIISKERFTKPAGLSHEIGVGFQFSSMKKKDYLVVAANQSDQTLLDQNKNSIYNQFAKYKAIGISYTLKIKKPISERILFSYGLRYNLTIGNFHDNDKRSSSNSSGYGRYEYTRHCLNMQYLNLFAGLSFML